MSPLFIESSKVKTLHDSLKKFHSSFSTIRLCLYRRHWFIDCQIRLLNWPPEKLKPEQSHRLRWLRRCPTRLREKWIKSTHKVLDCVGVELNLQYTTIQVFVHVYQYLLTHVYIILYILQFPHFCIPLINCICPRVIIIGCLFLIEKFTCYEPITHRFGLYIRFTIFFWVRIMHITCLMNCQLIKILASSFISRITSFQ